MQRGAQNAIDQINARGGVRGRSLKLRLADDSASEDAAVRVAQAFYDNPAVVAVVGHLTSDASIARGVEPGPERNQPLRLPHLSVGFEPRCSPGEVRLANPCRSPRRDSVHQ